MENSKKNLNGMYIMVKRELPKMRALEYRLGVEHRLMSIYLHFQNQNKPQLIHYRFDNLRVVTPKENSRNTTISMRNTSGNKGINKQGNYWKAQWNENDHKQHSKCFSIRTHGEEQAKALAIAFRKAREIEFGYM